MGMDIVDIPTSIAFAIDASARIADTWHVAVHPDQWPTAVEELALYADGSVSRESVHALEMFLDGHLRRPVFEAWAGGWRVHLHRWDT